MTHLIARSASGRTYFATSRDSAKVRSLASVEGFRVFEVPGELAESRIEEPFGQQTADFFCDETGGEHLPREGR